MKFIQGKPRNQWEMYCLDAHVDVDNEVRLIDLFVDSFLFKLHKANGHEPRQGLTRLPRKGAEAWPARCGGDVRSPRKPAGPAFRQPRSSPESPAAALKQPPQPTIKRNFKTHKPNGHELLSLPPIGGRTPAFVFTLKHSIWPLRRIISKRWLGAWMR